jgi:ABC-2 type transport system permease protein
MFGFWPIYKRELKTYFQSPSTYVVTALWFFIVGIIFWAIMLDFVRMSDQASQMGMFGQQQQAPNVTQFVIQGIFQVMTSLILFTIPLLSMRLMAEEKGRGTFELLVTCPISDWSILLGKYLALLTVGLVIVLISAVFPVLVWLFGRKDQAAPDWPIVYSCWIGMFLIFAAYAAFGVMASSFTENQVIAAVITLIGIILWNVMHSFVPPNEYPRLQSVLMELSASRHTENFNKGVLMLKDFAFYFLSSFLFLFVASKTLDARRWRV